MKSDLLSLVQQTENIKGHFHLSGGDGLPLINIVHDIAEFVVWKQEIQLELQDIHDRTNDKFIWSKLVNLKQGFNGWNDERAFNELSGSLVAISKNIDRYYSNELVDAQEIKETTIMAQKSPKIFISHASLDKDYVLKIVDFLEDVGLTGQQLFCSSVPGYDIPLDIDIYDYLKQQFEEHDLHVIFVLSKNYYERPACMNEMGAAWVLQKKYTTILLPNFNFEEIEGAINPRQNSLKLDSDLTEVKEKLRQLKETLEIEFKLSPIPSIRWEQKRDSFINSISISSNTALNISDNSLLILQAACSDSQGAIIKSKTLSGLSISVGRTQFITSQERREVVKWESALDELIDSDLITPTGVKGEIFNVSQRGYDYIDNMKK